MADEKITVSLPENDHGRQRDGNQELPPVNQVVPENEGLEYFTVKKPAGGVVSTSDAVKFTAPAGELPPPEIKVTRAAREYYLNMAKMIVYCIGGLIVLLILLTGGFSFYLVSRVVDDPRHGVTISRAVAKIDRVGWDIGKILDISADAMSDLRKIPADDGAEQEMEK